MQINNQQYYQRKNEIAGLLLQKLWWIELNAEKTELMRLNEHDERSYRMTYLNKAFLLTSIPKAKINGIIFQRNAAEMEQENVDVVCEKMDKHFKSWLKRSLTTLGKILIVKTFGISQVIYLLQSMAISGKSFK